MGKLIVQEFVSIDGLAAGPQGDVSFVPDATAGDPSFGQRQLAFIDSLSAMLLGRVTYQMFASYWPNVETGDDKVFADRLNALPKFVFSGTLDRAPWGRWPEATILRKDAAMEVERLKQEFARDLVLWGSLSLAQSLTRDGMIDEYQLIVCPVVLGSGMPLFGDKIRQLKLKLRNSQSFDRGTVLLAYAPA